MISQIKLTRHAIERFNERIGKASVDQIWTELERASLKHLDVLGKKKKKRRHVYIPTPIAVFVGSVVNGELVIKTVLQRGAA